MLVANGVIREQMVFCRAESMILTLKNLDGCLTEGLKKEDLGPMDVLYTYFCLFNRSKYFSVSLPSLITVIALNNEHCQQ